jgi:hypothetical protein
MTIDLNVLAKNRDALLLAEVAAWLNNIKQGCCLRAFYMPRYQGQNQPGEPTGAGGDIWALPRNPPSVTHS